MRRAESSWTDETVLRRVKRQLGVGPHPQFVQQSRAVRGHGLWRKAKLPADGGNGASCGQQAQHFELAIGELLVRCRRWSAEAVGDGLGHRGAQGFEIGRASCRGRGEISVVAGSLKKKKKKTWRCACRRSKKQARSASEAVSQDSICV